MTLQAVSPGISPSASGQLVINVQITSRLACMRTVPLALPLCSPASSATETSMSDWAEVSAATSAACKVCASIKRVTGSIGRTARLDSVRLLQFARGRPSFSAAHREASIHVFTFASKRLSGIDPSFRTSA